MTNLFLIPPIDDAENRLTAERALQRGLLNTAQVRLHFLDNPSCALARLGLFDLKAALFCYA